MRHLELIKAQQPCLFHHVLACKLRSQRGWNKVISAQEFLKKDSSNTDSMTTCRYKEGKCSTHGQIPTVCEGGAHKGRIGLNTGVGKKTSPAF